MKNHFTKRSIILTTLVVLLFTGSVCFSQTDSSDPLPGKFNQPIQFANLTPEYLQQATDLSISQAKESLEKLYAIPKEQRTFDNTMLEVDNIFNNTGNVSNSIDLMSNVHPDNAIRDKAVECNVMFAKFFNEVELDENLYLAVKDYS